MTVGPFDDGENVSLHALPRYIRTVTAFPAGDLVDLVQEDNARVLHPFDGQPRYLVHIDQPRLFLLHQVFKGLPDLHLALLGALAEQVGQHVLEVDIHLLDALVGDDLERRCTAFAHIDLYRALIQLAFAELLPQLFPGTVMAFLACRGEVGAINHYRPWGGMGTTARRARGGWRRGQQQIQQALFGVEFGPVFHLFQLFLAHHVHGDFHQVADHRFHVPSHVTDLGEFGGFYLHEGRIGELGQAARNLRLAHAGGPDHDDVLGHDLFGDIGRQLLPAHPVS